MYGCVLGFDSFVFYNVLVLGVREAHEGFRHLDDGADLEAESDQCTAVQQTVREQQAPRYQGGQYILSFYCFYYFVNHKVTDD